MSPQPKGGGVCFAFFLVGGAYCFWCGSRRRLRNGSFVSLCYLLNLNQWINFDQTCLDRLLGERKEFVRFR